MLNPPTCSVGLNVGQLYVGSLGGVTGVGGDHSVARIGVRDKYKVKEVELGNQGFIF